jgi:hypothetical protein
MRHCPGTPFLFECIYANNVVFEHQMMLRIFDTQFVVEGMENIGEVWYYLVPFLT